jgi:1-acyl-sn-glycerol-3-phosphate acyltransferase
MVSGLRRRGGGAIVKKRFGFVCGLVSLIFYAVNTLFWCIPIFTLAFFRLLIPNPVFQNQCRRASSALAGCWVAVNNFNQNVFGHTTLRVQGAHALDVKGKYLVLANHQSWVDILVLQRIFHRKIPFLKFFVKKELLWFPVLGQAWWALDFPFMKRYSKQLLQKKPHLKGKDLKITRKACEKFRTSPVSIINFVEGTRFTPEKHEKQQSPYQNLLKSKAGGIAHVLGSMGDQLNAILDVTIVYPQGMNSFWAFVCGYIHEVRVTVRSMPITQDLLGNYSEDKSYRERFHRWLNNLWEEKDRGIREMLA